MQHNTFNQPIGDALPDFTVGKMPDVQCLNGRFCRLERLSVAKHAEDLWLVYNHETRPQNWTYLPPSFGPFAEKSAFIAFLTQTEAAQDPYCFSIIDLATEKALGTFSLMRIAPANRVVEVGFIVMPSSGRELPPKRNFYSHNMCLKPCNIAVMNGNAMRSTSLHEMRQNA